MENALGLYNIVNSYQRDSGDGTSDDQAFTMSDKMQARFDAIKLANPTFTDDQIHDKIKEEDGSKVADVAGMAGAVLSVASQFGGDKNPLNKNLALKGGLTGAVSGASMGAKVAGVPGAIVGGVVMGAAGAMAGDKEQKENERIEKLEKAVDTNYGVANNNMLASLTSSNNNAKKTSQAVSGLYGVGDIDNFTNKYS